MEKKLIEPAAPQMPWVTANAGGSAHPPFPPDLCPASPGMSLSHGAGVLPASRQSAHAFSFSPAPHPPSRVCSTNQDGKKGQREVGVPEPTSSGGGLGSVTAAQALALFVPLPHPSLILSYKHVSIFQVLGTQKLPRGLAGQGAPLVSAPCVFHA